MNRLGYVLAAGLYVAAQLGIFIHEASALPEACADCDAGNVARWDCDGQDCHAPGHHHHDRHHHPGNCRVCSSNDLGAPENPQTAALEVSFETPSADAVLPGAFPLLVGRAIRAPPARALTA